MRSVMLFSGAMALWCSTAFADETISLDGDNTLTVTVNDVARTATVSVRQGDELVQSVTIGNANVAHGSVVGRRFCKGCQIAYFVPAYDRTSTYGAVTGIVAYSKGSWWALSILPLSVAGVTGPDASGQSFLTDTIAVHHRPDVTRYSFSPDGMLRQH